MSSLRAPSIAERVRWTEDEDSFILSHASLKSGVHDWESIAQELSERAAVMGQPGRTADAVRNHWHRLVKARGPQMSDDFDAEPLQLVVRPRVDRQKWTEGEDEIILQGVEEVGKSWRAIAKRLPPRSDTGKMRSDSSVRNRWQRLVNKENDANDPPSCGASPMPSESLPETLPEARPARAADPPSLFALPAPPAGQPTFGTQMGPMRISAVPAVPAAVGAAPAREFTRAQGRARYDMFEHPERSYRERSWRGSDVDVDDDLAHGLQTALAVGSDGRVGGAAPAAAALTAPPPFLSKAASSGVDAEQFATDVLADTPTAPTGEPGPFTDIDFDELLSIVGNLSPANSHSALSPNVSAIGDVKVVPTPLVATAVECP